MVDLPGNINFRIKKFQIYNMLWHFKVFTSKFRLVKLKKKIILIEVRIIFLDLTGAQNMVALLKMQLNEEYLKMLIMFL